MAILGGSPLGLIGVKSTPVQGTGMSTFNGGTSRNINVNKYNSGINPNAKKKGTESLLSGKTTLSPYGNIGSIGTDNGGGQGMDPNAYGGVNKNTLHNNAVYDTSLLNIIERLSSTVAAVRPSDFAYLKDVGVYPNNRLMIARRFLSPHNDNIYGKSKGVSSVPMAIMIAWKGQDDDFVEIDFGEEWVPANADFTNVMNSLGEDFGMSGKLSLGDIGNAAFNVTTLPGFSETLQRAILTRMGILDKDGADKPLPTGNPNLIKEAKRRKNVPYTDAGSGLKCSVSVKMTIEWEQKFISGIDPTIVFQDIIATCLRFGTSRSDFYGLSPAFEKKVERWINNPETLAKDFIDFITGAMKDIGAKVKLAIEGFLGKDKVDVPEENKKDPTPQEAAKTQNDSVDKAIKDANASFDKLVDGIGNALKKTIQKYRLEIEGIARALSGMPSTPWHITIGNPLRPVFCAGDMYMADNMKLTLGPNLAFNDLPSSIKADFTLTNARPWGLQEILAKFNAGSLRVSNGLKDQNSLRPNETLQNGQTDDGKPINDSAPSGTASTATASTATAATTGGASKVPNSAEQKPSIATVDVPKVGPLGAEETKALAAKKDAPVAPGTNAYGFPTTGLPTNPTPTMVSVPSVPTVTLPPGTPAVTTVATGAVASVDNVVPSAVSTTKEGNAGEQIVKDATSTIPVSVQGVNVGPIVK
jgi:hypothetical protein